MMYDLDDLDNQIIGLLKDDAWASSREIARKLGVSESTVRKRVNQLTDSGAVRFTAVTNFAALRQLIAFVGIHTDWQPSCLRSRPRPRIFSPSIRRAAEARRRSNLEHSDLIKKGSCGQLDEGPAEIARQTSGRLAPHCGNRSKSKKRG